jgi:hypothetical protein
VAPSRARFDKPLACQNAERCSGQTRQIKADSLGCAQLLLNGGHDRHGRATALRHLHHGVHIFEHGGQSPNRGLAGRDHAGHKNLQWFGVGPAALQGFGQLIQVDAVAVRQTHGFCNGGHRARHNGLVA